jgi:hypothetical protein
LNTQSVVQQKLGAVGSTVVCVFLFVTILPSASHSQLSEGGKPAYFSTEQQPSISYLNLDRPNVDSLLDADSVEAELGYAHRAGYPIPVDFSIENSGQWEL